MALTFDCIFVAEGREPSGFVAYTRHSPDGLRRSAIKVSAIWLQLAVRLDMEAASAVYSHSRQE